MLEYKLVPITIRNKPKLALVVGWSCAAEPDASIGVWCGSEGINDMFVICKNEYQAINMIQCLNTNKTICVPVQTPIMEYLAIKPAKGSYVGSDG